MEKVFVNRNPWKENWFHSITEEAVSAANSWVIPLMQYFALPISVDSIVDVMRGNVREMLIDEIIRKKANGLQLMPGELKRYQVEAEHEFSLALSEVIEHGERIKSHEDQYNRTLNNYKSQIRDKERQRAKIYHGNAIDALNQDIDAINRYIAGLDASNGKTRRDIIEDEKRLFNNMLEAKPDLSFARHYVKLENNRLVYDEAEIGKRWAVYAETKQEVKLIEKVKQLADLINEIYGNEFSGPREAFYRFFSVHDGRVVISNEITKEAIEKYAKNM